MPEPERTAKLRLLRSVAWTVLRPDDAARISICTRCCAAGCSAAWEAFDETMDNLATLSLRRLLVAMAAAQAQEVERR